MSANPLTLPEAPKGSATVTVACKLPAGIQLEIGRVGESDYQTYTVKGIRSKGALLDATGSFALTTIPAAFWDAWMRYIPQNVDGKPLFKSPQNPKHPHLKSGALYAHTDGESVAAHAQAYQSLRTGYEPLTTKDMPRGVEPLKRD